MKFDSVLATIGDFGFYQKRLYGLLCIPGITVGSVMMIVIIVLYTPKHRAEAVFSKCKIPGLDNDTYVIQDLEHERLINLTIPRTLVDEVLMYDKCNIYNHGEKSDAIGNVTRQMEECSEWIYDTSVFLETFTSQHDLVCSNTMKTSHGMMIFYFGVFVGDIIFGLMADLAGRKVAIYLALVVQVASAFGVAWAPNFLVYAILQFILGGSSHAVVLISAVISMEVVGPTYRKYTGVTLQVVSAIGVVYLAGVSYLFRQWTYIVVAVAVPCIFYLTYWWLIPESPRWLLSQNKTKQFEKVIRSIAKGNKIILPPDYFIAEEVEVEDETKDAKEERGQLAQFFRSPRLLRNALIMCFNWFVVSMTYFGVTMNAGNLGGNFYFNFFLMAIAEFPGYVFSLMLLDRIGRKKSNCLFLCLGGVAFICTIFTLLYGGPKLQPLTVVLSFIGKIGSSAAAGIVHVFAAELFPTVIRNVGMGAVSCAARLGGMLASYIAKSDELIGGNIGKATPLVIFGVLSILAGLSSLCLPETLNMKLPETIKDGEEFGRTPDKTGDIQLAVPFIKTNPKGADDVRDDL